MNQDENAVLRARLAALWHAAREFFQPLPPKVDASQSGDNHPEPDAADTKSPHRTSIQPHYRGGWRNLASNVSLIGSAMLGASFNFLNHSDKLFLAIAGFGIVFLLLGVWATSKHDKVEHAEHIRADRKLAQERARDEHERKLQRVVDGYLRVTEHLDPDSMNDGHRASFLLTAGITTLQDNVEIDAVLDRIQQHGRKLPALSVKDRKLLFAMLATENVSLDSDLALVEFILKHSDAFFPGEKLSSYE